MPAQPGEFEVIQYFNRKGIDYVPGNLVKLDADEIRQMTYDGLVNFYTEPVNPTSSEVGQKATKDWEERDKEMREGKKSSPSSQSSQTQKKPSGT